MVWSYAIDWRYIKRTSRAKSLKKFIQFIAGAICPTCKEQDSIAINQDDDEIYCVKCGYKEFRPGSKNDTRIKAVNVVDISDFKNKKK